MVTGLQKFSATGVRSRASSPKLQVFNTALLTARAGLTPKDVLADREFLGRLTESAVGAHLLNAAATGTGELYYWREGNFEVDFVLRAGRTLIAFEVKSGRSPVSLPGMDAFQSAFKPTRTLLVGGGGIPLDEFLARPVADWIE